MNISKCKMINPVRIEIVTCFEGHMLYGHEIFCYRNHMHKFINISNRAVVTCFSGYVFVPTIEQGLLDKAEHMANADCW